MSTGGVVMGRGQGIADALLWIAALTLGLGAGAAWLGAGSINGALAFVLAAATLAPPGQRLIGNVAHKMLPARLAFLSTITLVPLGMMFIAIDGVRKLDTVAIQRGFASAGQMARAHDLGLTTASALAAHDEAVQKSAIAEQCKAQPARPPLECYEPAHRRGARAFAAGLIDDGSYEMVVREALGQQRTAYLAADRNCAGLIDRIDAEALPRILTSRAAGIELSASIWARSLSQLELEMLTARVLPGVSYMRTSDMQQLEQKVSGLKAMLDREFDAELQTWARRLVSEESSWRAFIGGRSPPGDCRPAMAVAAH